MDARASFDLKFGGDLRWVRNNFNYDFYNNGSFFDFGFTSARTTRKRPRRLCRRLLG